ncbi:MULTISPECIES: TetR/AcrR family transcriptional regulator [unclassified Saccharopolyspora]|uniref:TetR/AcrR family transcriptional regulator n=1 Tax=unclassified Saccharopolyspora TaxID=2646250 RepID=UPI001CD39479|nr:MULTISPECIES: TetR/AcrR family transcriptional regulator [unclassified Saccharopolyspora]MCA1186986.1 TetR/AcrR family transcriptional regulator [Saccharopolyspora sp. 6T]MCA1192635.1 TetR/AcrR family transcriptional regulator [Saccharopolyspora sp. 6V]MCA1229633.1 TetR/AcrR family transcriptional regulator [Saccharopolyspora sp. 6M]MCA1283465.1 TetR/AcrR family transcriptional regulator [Saccharopolyspora sp. 7B]
MRRQQETREAILAAAYTLFCSKGYGGASLAEIAESAGFTKGAVYGLFRSKEDLFLALAKARTTELVAEVGEILGRSASRQQRLDALAGWVRRRADAEREWFLVNAEFSILAARRPHLLPDRRAAAANTVADVMNVLQIDSLGDGAGVNENVGRVVLALADGLALQLALDEAVDIAHIFTDALTRLLGSGPAEGRDRDGRS